MDFAEEEFSIRARVAESTSDPTPNVDTISLDEEGEVVITGIEYTPSTFGRERLGDTIFWKKFPLHTPQIIQFIK